MSHMYPIRGPTYEKWRKKKDRDIFAYNIFLYRLNKIFYDYQETIQRMSVGLDRGKMNKEEIMEISKTIGEIQAKMTKIQNRSNNMVKNLVVGNLTKEELKSELQKHLSKNEKFMRAISPTLTIQLFEQLRNIKASSKDILQRNRDVPRNVNSYSTLENDFENEDI